MTWPLHIRPIDRKPARAFVARHHSHHRAHVGEKLAISAWWLGALVGVVVMGRPNALELCDDATWEVTRLCTGPGAPPYTASRLLGRAGQAMDAVGIERAVSYTRVDERGTCYLAAGWTPVAVTDGCGWARNGRGTARRPAYLPGLHLESSEVVDRVRWERGPRTGLWGAVWLGSRWASIWTEPLSAPREVVGGGAPSVPRDLVTERVRVLIGDCRDRLAELEAKSVHTVCTSPPYWGLRNYGHDDQLGNEETPAEYVANMVEVFRSVRRVLRDDGTVWLNLGDSYAGSRKGSTGKTSRLTNPERYEECSFPSRSKVRGGLKAKDLAGIPWRVALAMQDDGWHLRAEIIWHKPNPLPESVLDRPTRSHEQIFLFSKRRRYYYDPTAMREPAVKGRSGNTTRRIPKDSGNEEAIPEHRPAAIGRAFPWEGTTRNRRSVWTVVPEQTKRAKGAPREKRPVVSFPPALIEPCVLAGAPVDGVVLDPFAGRGTTLAVAIAHQRCAIGIEVNPDQAARIAGRLRGTQVRIAECA